MNIKESKNVQATAQLTLYEVSKQLVANEKPMDPIQFNRSMSELADWIVNNSGYYYMLLCQDRRDYTLFHLSEFPFSKERLIADLSETIGNRGQLLLIEQQDESYEIWIRDSISSENFAYYLFNYDNGVIEVEE